jgi:hypothetical protein
MHPPTTVANGIDRAAARGTLHPATAPVDELEGQTNWRQERLQNEEFSLANSLANAVAGA